MQKNYYSVQVLISIIYYLHLSNHFYHTDAKVSNQSQDSLSMKHNMNHKSLSNSESLEIKYL